MRTRMRIRTRAPAVVIAALMAATVAATTWLDRLTPAAGGSTAFDEAALRERFPDPDAGAVDGDFVGSIECRDCHEDRDASLRTSAHADLLTKKGGARGCEECHGPGRVHYDDAGEGPIRHPDRATPAEVIGVCLRCHAEVLVKPVAGHREWVLPASGADGGADAGDDAGADPAPPRDCAHCHDVHVAKDAPAFDDRIGPFRTVEESRRHATMIPSGLCATCHSGSHPEMIRSGHASLPKEGDGCGSCHGAGSLHAQSGGDPRKIIDPREQKARDLAATCNACHAKGESQARWTCAEHAREGVSCITCHDANAAAGHTLRAPEYRLCGDCHVDVRARFEMRNRHRVKEGRMACSDCHDPHGNRDRVRDRELRRDVCIDCHGEKGAPFLHDHGIKRTEGCVVCHDPHGSPNRRMLTHSRIKPLCLQCHADAPHDLARRRYDVCTACHAEIHGSDLDRIFRR